MHGFAIGLWIPISININVNLDNSLKVCKGKGKELNSSGYEQ